MANVVDEAVTENISINSLKYRYLSWSVDLIIYLLIILIVNGVHIYKFSTFIDICNSNIIHLTSVLGSQINQKQAGNFIMQTDSNLFLRS